MTEPLTVDNFTHFIECYHQIGRNRRRYWMKCHILGTTPGGKAKIQVYGNLYWGGDCSRVRYVEPFRVKPKHLFTFKES